LHDVSTYLKQRISGLAVMNRANNVKIRIANLTLSFGGNTALSGLNMEIREGEILAIIGPNGAGKTCLLNCINGFYRPQEGEIYFEGRKITQLPSYRAPRLGIASTLQNWALIVAWLIMGRR
jgi:branched-chain amino acid transport system ATP-binding protein